MAKMQDDLELIEVVDTFSSANDLVHSHTNYKNFSYKNYYGGKSKTRVKTAQNFEQNTDLNSGSHQAKQNVEIFDIASQKMGMENIPFHMADLPAFKFDAGRRYRKKDFKYNFTASKLTAWVKMDPFGVDMNSTSCFQMTTGHDKWWKNMVSLGWYLLACFRVLILDFSAIRFIMTSDKGTELHRITLVAAVATTCNILMPIMALFYLNRVTMVSLLSSTLAYLDKEPGKNKNGTWRFHSVKELIMIHLPFLVYSMTLNFPILSIIDPSFPLILVSFFPSGSGFSWAFLLIVVCDWVVYQYFLMVVHKVFYMFMGIHRIQEEARLAIRILKMETDGKAEERRSSNITREKCQDEKIQIQIQKAIKSLGLLHMWTQYYNMTFSSVVYCCKLTALSAAIFGGFGFIKMIQVENWPYAGIFFIFFLEGMILYTIAFGRAFEIPEQVQELKRQIRERSFRSRIHKDPHNSQGSKYVEKYLRSVPWLGVKDGVYIMEKLTIVNFITYAVEQITSMVIAN